MEHLNMSKFKVCTADRKNKKIVVASSLDELKTKGCHKFGIAEVNNCRVVDETDGFEIDDDEGLMAMLNHTLVILQPSEDWAPSELVERLSSSGSAACALGASSVSSKYNYKTPTSNYSHDDSEGSLQNLPSHDSSNEYNARPTSERQVTSQPPINARQQDISNQSEVQENPTAPTAVSPHFHSNTGRVDNVNTELSLEFHTILDVKEALTNTLHCRKIPDMFMDLLTHSITENEALEQAMWSTGALLYWSPKNRTFLRQWDISDIKLSIDLITEGENVKNISDKPEIKANLSRLPDQSRESQRQIHAVSTSKFGYTDLDACVKETTDSKLDKASKTKSFPQTASDLSVASVMSSDSGDTDFTVEADRCSTSSQSRTNTNNLNKDLQNIRRPSRSSFDGNYDSKPYILEQQRTRTVSTKEPDTKNLQTVLQKTLPLKSMLSDVKLLTQQEYYKITKIIPRPEISEAPAKEHFDIILPYIRQRVKMRGCHVLQPSRIVALFDVGKKSMFSISNDPFRKSSSRQQVVKGVSCPISRLDFITCLLLSADDIVKADLLSIMAQFPMALPLIMRNYDEGAHSIMSPYLCGLKVKWETGFGESQRTLEHSLFRDKYRLLVAVRLGSNHTGKSTILNQLLAIEHTFSSVKEPGARYGKPLSLDGTVEMVWLTRETCKHNFWSTISKFYSDSRRSEICLLANLHGNATEFSKTLRILNEMSCKYLAFVCNDCSPEQWNNFQQCVGEDQIMIRVDPDDCQPHSLNDIETNHLIGDETQEKIRQIVNIGLESCVPSTFPERLTCRKSGKVSLPAKIATAESEQLLAFVEKYSCKTVKGTMKLQKLGYSKDSEIKKRDILRSDKELPHIIKLISSVLNLPHHNLQRAIVHLEKELARLSDVESQGARDMSSDVRKQLRAAKMKGDSESAISQMKTKLDSALKQIGDCYLATENLFREIGCVHEISPSYADISFIYKNVAKLFIDGQAVELVDGDRGIIPEVWLKSIFSVVEKEFPNLRVFVVSVIGLQSSGKSTLLNTLFACRFAVSVGRCTRGLFMRLLFLDKELAKTHKFDAILLIDTEGLGSPEKMNDKAAAMKDRQMATFAMSISNLTLINVLGENIIEMAAILQIAILALTRLEKAKIKPDIMMNQCLVTEKDAQKSSAGQDQFITAISSALDLVDKEGIHVGTRSSECLKALIKRVEEGSMLTQLRSYKNGATANAPPSEVYHEDALDLYKTILECGKTSETIFEFKTWRSLVTEFWKAVGNEDFASRFEDIKAITEFINREERIAQCKRSIDAAFYAHEAELKKSIESEVNKVVVDDLGGQRVDEREAFLETLRKKLNEIPAKCKEDDKCSESSSKVQLLYDSINDKRVKDETIKSIDQYTTRIRESTMNMLRQMFDAEIVRRGCSVDFDNRINELLHNYLEKRRGKQVYSPKEREEISGKIYKELKILAKSKKSPIPITETFTGDLNSVYKAYPTMCLAFEADTLKFEDILEAHKSLQDHKKHSWMPVFFKRMIDSSGHVTGMPRELEDLKIRLSALPQQLITRYNAECYDHGMMEELMGQTTDVFRRFQKTNEELCKCINVMRLHIWVQQLLLKRIEVLHKKWDEKTNPLLVLKANKEKYTAIIKARLEHGFGFKSEGNVIAKNLENAIKDRAAAEAERKVVTRFIAEQNVAVKKDKKKNDKKNEAGENEAGENEAGENEAGENEAGKNEAGENDKKNEGETKTWRASTKLLRFRYFGELALQVEKGQTDRALRHFEHPEEEIEAWFGGYVNNLAAKWAQTFFRLALDKERKDVIARLETKYKIKDLLQIVKEYYAYSPNISLDKVTEENVIMLRSELLEELKLLQLPKDFSLKEKPSENKLVKKGLGCTAQCYWCDALCVFSADHENRHETSHQPQGLATVHDRNTRHLLSRPCHKMNDDTTVYWGDYYDKGLLWSTTKDEHFKQWVFSKYDDKTFDDLMCWFFQELHVDIAQRCSTSLKPANDVDLKTYRCVNLKLRPILHSTIKELNVSDIKDPDIVIKALELGIELEEYED